MKKGLVLFLLLYVLLLPGCSRQDTADTVSPAYDLYFLERDLQTAAGGGALRTENTWLTEIAWIKEEEKPDTQRVVEALLEELLNGPEDETLASPFPAGTDLLAVEIEGNQAIIDLSSAYGGLSGIRLTLADQAVTMTLTQLPDILSVKIMVRGEELPYRDQQVFMARDVLLAPEGDVVGRVGAKLYFLNERGSMVAEERILELYEGDTQVSAVARAMENGPQDRRLFPVLPNGFRIKSVWQEENVCYVNLSSGALDTLPETTLMDTVLCALARAFGSLETVNETHFLVDGEFAENYGTALIGQSYMM